MDRNELAPLLTAAIPGLLRYARSITADETLAEDLVSDTLVRALERSESFRGDAALQTWLHRILHNLAVDAFRRQREFATEDVVDQVEQDWRDDAYTVDAATVVARAETSDELLDALVRLPFDYRAAVVLHDAHGLTNQQVAEVQAVSLPAAKQRLRRGRMMLVSALAQGAERRAALKGVPLGCWEARAKVSDYLDDDLPQSDRKLLEAHLDTCPTCPPLYASLVGATEALKAGGRDPDSVIDPAVLSRISERARA
ncbi:MAG: sigma-70 family RNA polymerase sigma factor [Candidatus Nanopelagicales bacterium]